MRKLPSKIRRRKNPPKVHKTFPTIKYAGEGIKHTHRQLFKSGLHRRMLRKLMWNRKGIFPFHKELDVLWAEKRLKRNPEKGKGSCRLRARVR